LLIATPLVDALLQHVELDPDFHQNLPQQQRSAASSSGRRRAPENNEFSGSRYDR